MAFQIILIVASAALLVVPQWFSTHTARRHSERLLALRNGASERYFEELRDLETYRPRGGRWPYRIFGLAMMVFAFTQLVLYR